MFLLGLVRMIACVGYMCILGGLSCRSINDRGDTVKAFVGVVNSPHGGLGRRYIRGWGVFGDE